MTKVLTVSADMLEQLAFTSGAEITHMGVSPRLVVNGVTYVAEVTR